MGALLNVVALQYRGSAIVREFPHALLPEASPSSPAMGNKNHGAWGVKETPACRRLEEECAAEQAKSSLASGDFQSCS